MKNISTTVIIDEAIRKLEGLKGGVPDELAVKELYAIRAYCDLLLRAAGEQSEKEHSLRKPQPSPEAPTHHVAGDDANSGSIFDF